MIGGNSEEFIRFGHWLTALIVVGVSKLACVGMGRRQMGAISYGGGHESPPVSLLMAWRSARPLLKARLYGLSVFFCTTLHDFLHHKNHFAVNYLHLYEDVGGPRMAANLSGSHIAASRAR